MRRVSDDVDRFIETPARESVDVRAINAELLHIPNVGSRLLVERAINTAAADPALRAHGAAMPSAHSVMADTGSDMYLRILVLSPGPSRMIGRDPGTGRRHQCRRWQAGARPKATAAIGGWPCLRYVMEGEGIRENALNEGMP